MEGCIFTQVSASTCIFSLTLCWISHLSCPGSIWVSPLNWIRIVQCYSLTCACVSRDVWICVWPLRDAGLRWREGEGVGNVSGIQHHHLDCRRPAGKALSTACVSHQSWQMCSQVRGVTDSVFRGWDSPSARAGHAFVHLCLCLLFSGAGWSGHSSGHQVCRQHSQGFCYIALHHLVDSDIILLATGLWSHQVEETAAASLSLSFFNLCFSFPWSQYSQADGFACCHPQHLLPGGRFGYRGHFPVWLWRQVACQPQQGVGHLTADITAAVGGVRRGKEDRGGGGKKGERSLSYVVLTKRKRQRKGSRQRGGKQVGSRRQEEKVKTKSKHNTAMGLTHQKCLSWEERPVRTENCITCN